MKILHTADWHLNDQLGDVDRTAALQDRVQQVAAIGEREAVDVLLIVGDLFSEQAKPDQIAASMRHIRTTFRPFFERGGTILAVTGNHDQDGRLRASLELARASMDIAAPPRRPGDLFTPGRFYLIDTVSFGRLRDPQGQEVQFALLPFPAHSRMLVGDETATTAEELNRPIAQRIKNWIHGLCDDKRFNKNVRTVLAAHMSVTGADISRGRFELTEQRDVVADANDLPTSWDYIALGHLHKPQCIGGLSHVRYSGSLDRMDHGERDDDKGVVLVEIGPDGRQREPQFIPIAPTVFQTVVLNNPAITKEELQAQLVVPEALVKVEFAPTVVDAKGELYRMVQETVPNVTRIVPCALPLHSTDVARTVPQHDTIRATVLAYLQQRIPDDDPQRTALLKLATHFLDLEGVR